MKTNASLRRFLRSIYGYSFFNKLMLISPVYAVFMQDHGMSDMQLSVLFILLSVTTILSQMPIAWITNKLGQKNTIQLGQLLKGVGFVLWLIWPTFWGFAAGMCLWGVMTACYDTAFEGILYDELRARHHNNIYARVLGKRYNVQAFGAGVAAFGSLLMFAGYEWITIATLVSIAISMIYIARIDVRTHPATLRRPARRVRFMKLFRNAFHVCRATPCILLTLIVCELVANFSYLDDYLSPIGVEIGLPVVYVGLMQFFVLGCMILGQTYAYKFEKVRDWVLYSLICALGGCFVLFSIDYSVGGLLWLGAAYVLSSGLFVLLYSRFQDFVPTTQRTIMLSIYSITDNIVYILLCLIMGIGGTLGSWRYSILWVGAMLIMVGVWALVFVGNKCAINMNPKHRGIKTAQQIGSDVV